MVRAQQGKRGFSLLELLICLVVMMVVTVAAFPTINKNLQIIRLQSSVQDVATLMQRARILAVKNNTTYSIVFSTVNNVEVACIDTNYDGTCNPTEPMVAMAKYVSLVTDGSGADYSQITCGPLTSTCPTGFTGLNFQAQAATAFVSYNDRGLPCVGPTPTTEPIPTASRCDELPGGNPVGFVLEFQYAGSNGKTYAAVSLTPTGLTGEWLYGGSYWGQQ
jgi:prepilin-type N-terminal cleavage/methylation domain-containing protein